MRTRPYFGRHGHRFETSRYRLTESSYRSRAELPRHSHENAHFCLVLSGSYSERLGGRPVEREPGDLIFYAPGVDHSERHHVTGKHFLIELAPDLARAVAADVRVWSAREGASRQLATRLFVELRRDGSPPESRMGDLVDRLVEGVGERADGSATDSWLADVEMALRRAPDASLDLGRLAREARVHRVSLGRAFKRVYGTTPGEYLRRLRVERALKALAAGADIAAVAYDAGFCDQSHLNRVFKRQTGATPGQFRRWVTPAERVDPARFSALAVEDHAQAAKRP